MTETYNGYWNPLRGDVSEPVQDVYHKYPVNKQTGILDKPLAGASRIEVVSQVVQAEAGGI